MQNMIIRIKGTCPKTIKFHVSNVRRNELVSKKILIENNIMHKLAQKYIRTLKIFGQACSSDSKNADIVQREDENPSKHIEKNHINNSKCAKLERVNKSGIIANKNKIPKKEINELAELLYSAFISKLATRHPMIKKINRSLQPIWIKF